MNVNIHSPETLQKGTSLYVSFDNLYSSIPQARAIYNKHCLGYTDEHSKWLGRWVNRAERHLAEKSSSSDDSKQEITDKLINKLVLELLVSPYDKAPFVANTEKRPVLFKGILFPYWMLEDIFNMLGIQNGMVQTKDHLLINEMLAWTKSLKQYSKSIVADTRAIVPVKVGGELAVMNQTVSPTHLDNALLVGFNFNSHPELAIIKLLTYRDLVVNAFREMDLRKKNRVIKKQFKQIVRFGEEQKALMEREKEQNIQARAAHEQEINRQFADISQIQADTHNTMEEHLQNLIEQMNLAEERMKKAKQDCKNKEAQIQSLITAQQNLH